MTSSDTSLEIELELYLRGDTYGTYEPQREVLDSVRELEAADLADTATVETGWRQVRTGAGRPRDEALEQFERFREWATTSGYDLEPAFRRRKHTAFVTGETRDVVSFPVICLAVRLDDALQAVFPCRDGETTYTVHDCLDAFEAGNTVDWLTRFGSVDADESRTPVRT